MRQIGGIAQQVENDAAIDLEKIRLNFIERFERHTISAKIADGEYVFPASFVTALGQGDNKKGSEILDGLREKLREHKRKAPLDSIPPKAKTPIDYIKKGKK